LQFSSPLIPATLIKRYKRFLADVRLTDGSVITVHTPNTGSMLGVAEPGSTVWLRDTQNDKRKYRYSWDISETDNGVLVGVNTAFSNLIVKEAIEAGLIPALQGYSHVCTEVKYGKENSRIDLLLKDTNGKHCYVEVKNVTALDAQQNAFFPDAVTQRGAKHLRELMGMVEAGYRAVLFFCVQRRDALKVRPADEIDPEYGQTLRAAALAGVEIMAWRAGVAPERINLEQALPVIL